MNRFLSLLLCVCVLGTSFAQTTGGPSAPVRVSQKDYKKLNKKEVAFQHDGYDYYFKGSSIYRRKTGSGDKIRPADIYSVRTVMNDVNPEVAEKYRKGDMLSRVGCLVSLFVCMPAGLTMACVGVHRVKGANREFYESLSFEGGVKPETAVAVEKVVETPVANNNTAVVNAVEETVVSAEPTPVAPQVTNEPIENRRQTESKAEPVAQVNKPQQTAPAKVEKEKNVYIDDAKRVKVKEPKERGPKLTERKEKGVGLWVDPLGFVFRGPRLGLDVRLKRNIPFAFVGCPHLGSGYMSEIDGIESEKSISCGVGYKHLVPASWGGFYVGAFGQYNRLSGDINSASSYRNQKIFESGIDVMANLGFRFQFKNNLFFNVGGYAGVANNTHEYRFTNKLSDYYSPKYIKGKTETSFKGGAEVSLGFEF
ncbi:MAG: hypothetical protein MJZ19_11545 [Paludibacteraceae bacterium]|nr:hypothetical protein [Paludibacteraceae bacterium]